jgi:hypothetical protein
MPKPTKPAAHLLYEQSKWETKPAAKASKYRKWRVPMTDDLDGELGTLALDPPMDKLEALADFNFGTNQITDRGGAIAWYLTLYAGFTYNGEHPSNMEGADVWLWIPGDDVFSTLDNLGPIIEDSSTPTAPLTVVDPISVAPRSQSSGPGAQATIGKTFLPGDVLLVEHQQDSFIQEMTLTWPTHAGICADPAKDKAVDAMPYRGDKSAEKAVAETGLNDFFKSTVTPGGGLVYRYTGGDSDEANRKTALAAATWAWNQRARKYHFTLKSSIVGDTKKKTVEENRFDTAGEAVDEGGQAMTIETSTGAIRKLHTVYCAELVWRAYHFGANVDLVDPKKFFCMYDHTNRALAGLITYCSEAELRTIVKKFSKFPGTLATATIARNLVLKMMKSRHNGYLCAPHQFLESDVLEQVHTFPASPSLKKHVIHNFRGADIHPRAAAQAMLDCLPKPPATEPDETPFKTWCNDNSEAYESSVGDPLHLQPKA